MSTIKSVWMSDHWRLLLCGAALLAGALLCGCQAPQPKRAEPTQIAPRKAATLPEVQRLLSEAESALSTHRYEEAVSKTEQLWQQIPAPDRFRGSVKDYKVLTDAAARSAEIPMHAWRRRGDFINERQAIEGAAERYAVAEAYSLKILRQIEEITRDAAMRARLRDYRSSAESEYRRWQRELITATAVADVLSRSGRNRTAVKLLRDLHGRLEIELADADSRTRLLDDWDDSWEALGFERIVANALQDQPGQP